MARRPSRRGRWLALAGVLAIAGALWLRSDDTPRPRPEPTDTTAATSPATPAQAPGAPVPGAPARRPGEADPAGDVGPLLALPETPWAAVDLEAIREVMPDNLFWKMAVPTTDPEIVAERARERDRWNVEYGKVLSGTATAEEVDAYYAERQRLAQDYVEFATYLLAEYGDALTVRDVGLLKVAIELNLARLERFPRQIVEAHERREAHDAARRAWREQQRAFEDAPIR